MKRKYEISSTPKPRSYKIDIPFSDQEKERFLAFVAAHGKARGPWARVVLIRAMDAEEKALAEVSR